MLAWNTGPGVALAEVVGGRDAVVTGAAPGVVTVEVVRGAGAGLADVPPGEGRGPPEAGAWLPAQPAHRPTAATASAMVVTRTRHRVGPDTA